VTAIASFSTRSRSWKGHRSHLRLHEVSLLPEENRETLVETVTEYAVHGEDLYALSNSELREAFTDSEYESMRNRARSELIPRLGEVCDSRQSEYGGDETPDEHMQPLLDSLETLKAEFDDPEVDRAVLRETQRANNWIAEHGDDEEVERPGRSLGNVESLQTLDGSRSIFDDVDA